jgi:hypothetical protein
MVLKLRLMVKRILRKCKYLPDQQEGPVYLVLRQAEALGRAERPRLQRGSPLRRLAPGSDAAPRGRLSKARGLD